MQDQNPIQVSGRIFNTIEYLARSGPTGLFELSSHLQLNKSTVHRILNSLIYMDYVRQDPETSKYYLSFKFCHISNQILARNNIIDSARPFIRKLVDRTGETVHLVQIDGTNAVYIDKKEADLNSVRLVSMVGKTIPLYCSGVGKALLADKNDAAIKEIWAKTQIEPFTPYTITDFDKFMEVIARTRTEGYALDNEENELGVCCIAVSLKDYSGQSSYAVSISAPKNRMEASRIPTLKEALLHTKLEIEQAIGNVH